MRARTLTNHARALSCRKSFKYKYNLACSLAAYVVCVCWWLMAYVIRPPRCCQPPACCTHAARTRNVCHVCEREREWCVCVRGAVAQSKRTFKCIFIHKFGGNA